MSEQHGKANRARLSGEDLTFWWADSPMQPTTMAMLMLLDGKPDERRLREAFERTVTAVPRLAERVVDAPLDLTLPHWERDPTFDLDYHLRHHALSGAVDLRELLREVSPAYETPFDRTRPLWEARIYGGVGPSDPSALFFKLHHAVADGIGGNAIFAALTDAERAPTRGRRRPRPPASKKAWPGEPALGTRLVEALRDRVELDIERAGALANTVVDTIRHPEKIATALKIVRSVIETARFDSHSPVKNAVGRTRRLSGLDLPFSEVREVKRALGGSMIDVILTTMARAMGKWHNAHRLTKVRELMTLVPVNLRKPEEWAHKVETGNVATGIMVPLPIRMKDPLANYREIHKRMEAKKADPMSAASPALAELFNLLGRSLVTWMTEASFGTTDFIVTNVPGILVPRYLAGTEILAAYPFAPVAMKSPASVALYGYRDRLFIGIDSDEAAMPDVDTFDAMIAESFAELSAAARTGRRRPARKRPSKRHPAR